MTEPMWSAFARHRIAGRRLVVIGIGVDQMRGFLGGGCHIVGAISVVPAGDIDGEPPSDEPFEVLTLESSTRDILEHVVAEYAATIEVAGTEVTAFLDRVDPDRSAAVAGYLPMPHGVLGGREVWVADSAISIPLEHKTGMAGALPEAVAVIPTVPLPLGDAEGWWDRMCGQLGARRLVVQRAGLSGGGTGTYVCDGPGDVPTCIEGFVSPFVEGRACNVMGVVDDEGQTLVLPASRQLIRLDERGQPLYSGNVTGERWATQERTSIGEEVRAIGATLATRGFFGPFGVDFITTRDGRRLYHDLNPRMNGVIDSLARLLDTSENHLPLIAVVLSRPRWQDDEFLELEADLHEAAAQIPRARLWLTTMVDRPLVISATPRAGVWRIDVENRCVEHLGDSHSVRVDVSGSADLADLQPMVPPGLRLMAGDRLALGNLYCRPELADAISDVLGPWLINAFLA